MSDPVNLSEARAVKRRDSREWTAEEMLVAALRDVRAGDAKPLHICIHYLEAEPDGGYCHRYYAAGATFQQHIALLQVALQRTVDAWIR